MMNAQGILTELKKLGKPVTAAIYRRHGSGDNVFGVLTSDIAKLQKRIKTDHALAIELWKTGNAEARILALQIADPGKLSYSEADTFAGEAESDFVGCYLSSLLARSPLRPWLSPRPRSTYANALRPGVGQWPLGRTHCR